MTVQIAHIKSDPRGSDPDHSCRDAFIQNSEKVTDTYIKSSGANILDDHENIARSRSRISRSSRFPIRVHQTVEVPPRLHEERRHGRVPPQRIQKRSRASAECQRRPRPPPAARARSRAADRPRPAPLTRRRRRIRSVSFPGRRTSPGTPRPSSERTRRAGPRGRLGPQPAKPLGPSLRGERREIARDEREVVSVSGIMEASPIAAAAARSASDSAASRSAMTSTNPGAAGATASAGAGASGAAAGVRDEAVGKAAKAFGEDSGEDSGAVVEGATTRPTTRGCAVGAADWATAGLARDASAQPTRRRRRRRQSGLGGVRRRARDTSARGYRVRRRGMRGRVRPSRRTTAREAAARGRQPPPLEVPTTGAPAPPGGGDGASAVEERAEVGEIEEEKTPPERRERRRRRWRRRGGEGGGEGVGKGEGRGRPRPERRDERRDASRAFFRGRLPVHRRRGVERVRRWRRGGAGRGERANVRRTCERFAGLAPRGPTPSFISGRVSVGSAGAGAAGKGRSSRREGEGRRCDVGVEGVVGRGREGREGREGRVRSGVEQDVAEPPGDARLGGFAGARGGPSRLASTPRGGARARTWRRRRGDGAASAPRGAAWLGRARASARRGSGGRRGASPR